MKRFSALFFVFILVSGFVGLRAQNSSTPMILPEWHQTAPWNRYCPGQGQNRAHAGSHALAMAKTMKYWAYPYSGTGSVSYVDDNFGPITQNFATVIEWGGMSNTQVFATTQRFIASCGAAALTDYEMDYSTSSLVNIRNAMINNFIYDNQMQIVQRADYALTSWEGLIRNEIDNQRPVIYSVMRADGTELAFIIDAYNTSNLFHANFSDDANPNAWLDLGALVISEEPIGSGQQSMLFGIMPSLGPDTISENFEDGFGYHNWQFSGNANWTISTESAFFGSHSAKSGNIDHNQITRMYITIDVSEESQISFYKRVSCENHAQNLYDHLRFEIDGVEMERWSGNGQWGFHEYPVSPGVHTFSWIYAKDGATTGFDDCAWVDAITFPPGNTPLMPPRELTASLSGQRNVALSWLPPLVTDGLLGYRIFRNNNQIAQYSNPQQISFMDYDLPNGEYSYHLQAVYSAGLSLPSNSAELEVEVLYAPFNVAAHPSSYSSLMLTWEAPPLLRNRALLGYNVYRDEALIATLNHAAELSYHDLGLDPGVYYYQVSARYSGGESPLSNVAMGILGVAQPPANLQAMVSGNDVTLNWSPGQDVQNLIGFKVYRDAVQIAHIHNPISYEYLDENLANGSYSYFVRAIYQDVESGNSVTVHVNIEVPYAPTNLVAIMINNNVQLNWQRPPLNRALTHYYIYRDGQVIGAVFNPNNTSYTDHDLAPGIYTYYVTAFYSGIESPPSNIASTGSEPLLPPQDLSYTLLNNDVELFWQPPVIYDRDLTGYRVWRNESVIADNHPNNIYLDADLPNGTYQYKVAAIYTDGISEPTPTITVTVAYAQAPVNLQASLNDPDVHLSWQAAPTGPTPDSYRVYRNGAMIVELSQNTYTDRVPNSGYYTYYVTAMFGSYESEPSNSVTEFVNYAAQTPVINGQTLGNTVVLNIDRGFVPEGLEFAFTTIFRNGEVLINITEDYYIDSDLPNGNYEYFCYAVYGFEHPHVTFDSNIYSATIDLIYAPSNLSGALDGTTISLNWDGVYSPLRPISYKVYRNGVMIAQTEDTNFTDPDLPGGNYSYYVTAMFGSQESGATNGVTFYVEELLPPSNLTGSVIGRDIHLNWSAPEIPTRELLGYRVWRNGSEIVNQTGTTGYVDSDLPNGNYQYQVAAVYNTGLSEQTPPLNLNVSYAPAPQDLSGIVSNMRLVSLSWSGPGDVDADYYKVYRNGEYLAEASWETAEDMPATSGSYTYFVSAVYGDLESTPSNSLTLEVNTDPSTIVLSGEITDNDISLSWSVLQTPPSGELLRYEIFRNSTLLAESMVPYHTDNDLPNAPYEYRVRAVFNWYGIYETALSNPFSTTIDLPYPPEGLQYSVDQNNVSLSWQPVTSLQSPVSYRVYRNGVAVSQNDATEHHDLGLANGSYSYYVTTLFGNEESLPSESVFVHIEIPYPPQELSAQVVEDSVILNWNAPSTGATRALTGYYIYRNGSLLQSLSDPSQTGYTDSGVPNGEYSYYLRAVYGIVLSETSNTVNVVVNVAPDLFPPTNLSAMIIGERDVQLHWDAPEGNPELYLIYRNGNQIGSASANTYLDADLANGAYQYYVRAQYPEGISTPSNSVPVNIMNAYPPTNLSAEVQNQTDISLSWSAPNQGETAYLVFVNNVETAFIADPAITTHLLEDMPNGLYNIYLKAVYPAAISVPGNMVSASIEVLYHAEGFSWEVSGRNVELSWEPLDNFYGFQHYVIYRNYLPYQQLVNPGFTDLNLPNGEYLYQLGVTYTFGNSVLSPAEALEIQVAEAAQNLVAIADGNSVQLSWDPSPDTGYLEAYKVFHNDTMIGESAGTTYSLDDLPNGIHSFHVIAAYSFADAEASNTATATIEVAYPPANLNALALQSTVNLNWDAPPAHALAHQFLGYRVYRDGGFLAEIATPDYSDAELVNGVYLYEVSALYAFGESPRISANATVFITYPPTNLVLAYYPPNGVTLGWDRPQMGETGFRLYRNERLIAVLAPEIQIYNDGNLPNGNHSYRVSAMFGEVESAPSNDIVAHILQAYTPYGLSLINTGEHIQLTWGISDAGLLSHYLIFQNEVEIGSSTQTQFNAPIPPNGLHTYYVIAVYENDLWSPPSNFAHINLQISYPVTLSGSHSGSSALLNWTPITDTGGFVGYYLYCDGLIAYNGTATNFHHQNIPNGEHNYHVKVRYQWGDSAPSNTYTAGIWVPYPPTDLVSTVSGNDVQLSWNATQDATQLLGYRIMRDGGQIALTNETSYLDEDLSNGNHSYEIRAVYEFGTSFPILADIQIQVAYPPQNVDYSTDQNNVVITWDNPSDTTYFQYFRIYRDDVLLETTTTNAFSDPSLPNAAYEYTVTSVYEFGESEPSPTLLILIQIAYPARNLKAEVDGMDVHLDWIEPVDTGFFTAYKIYRDDVLIAETPSTGRFMDTNVMPGPHEYWIVANYSFGDAPASNIAEALVMDFQIPQNLHARSEGSSVILYWDPVQTSTLFLNYRIYRDNQYIGGNVQTSFMDIGLPNGSYSYQVSALYTVGESELSQSLDIDHIMAYPPRNLGVDVERNLVSLTWNTPLDTGFLSGFRVYRNGEEIGDVTYEASRRDNYHFEDSIFEPGFYSYRVASLYGDLVSPPVVPSDPEDDTIEILWPFVPQNLSVQQVDSGLQLAWDAVPDDPDFVNYKIYLNGEIHSTSLQPQTTIMELANGTYSLRVSTLYTQAESPLSEEVNISLIYAHAPRNFTANVVGSNRVSLSWQLPQDTLGFTEFVLYRGAVLLMSGTETSYMDEALPNGNYSYRLYSKYGTLLSTPVNHSAMIADIAPAQNVVAEATDDAYLITFQAPDLLFAPDFYEVYFIPDYPNSPMADWVYVETRETPGSVMDLVHGGLEYGNFTWAVTCGWHDVPETGIAYSNSILVPKTPEYNYLVGNYPNPFNASTSIVFWLKEDSRVSLKIYNLRGQLVRKLISSEMSKGTHTQSFDGKDDSGRTLASGTYIYHLQTKGYSRSRKMTLSK